MSSKPTLLVGHTQLLEERRCLGQHVVILWRHNDVQHIVWPMTRLHQHPLLCQTTETSDQSNLVKGRIAVYSTPRLYLPGDSSNLQLHVLARVQPQIPHSIGVEGPPSNTTCHGTPWVNLPNGTYMSPQTKSNRNNMSTLSAKITHDHQQNFPNSTPKLAKSASELHFISWFSVKVKTIPKL